MSPPLFQRIDDDIRDPVLGCTAFQGNTDAVGRAGASAMQKIVAVIRQLTYGTANDAQTEYRVCFLSVKIYSIMCPFCNVVCECTTRVYEEYF